MIDQQKAFNRDDHTYLFGILKSLNLPDNFINWVKIMYTEIYSKVAINGATTKEIKILRSVRQGCPLSMLLFVLSAERLAEKIRTNKNIEGYKITPTTEKKLVAYADDTTLILTNKKSKNSINTINDYCKASGALTNTDKTEAIISGPWKLQDLCESLGWIKDEVKILGIKYAITGMNSLNYKGTTEELKSKMENWGKRSHNILGRSYLLNIYAMPKLLYKMKHIEIPKEMQKKIQSYGKTKFKRYPNIKLRNLGGTGLFNTAMRQQALWTQELVDIINNPNTEENLLKRSTIGPSPRLMEKIRQKT